MSANKPRTVILTIAVAAITATGAWYGAGLKIGQEVKQTRQAASALTPDEKIAQLETMRARYVQQQKDIQGKLDRLAAKKVSSTTSAS